MIDLSHKYTTYEMETESKRITPGEEIVDMEETASFIKIYQQSRV